MTRRSRHASHGRSAPALLALVAGDRRRQGLGTSRVSTARRRSTPAATRRRRRAHAAEGRPVTIESVNEGWISVRVEASGERLPEAQQLERRRPSSTPPTPARPRDRHAAAAAAAPPLPSRPGGRCGSPRSAPPTCSPPPPTRASTPSSTRTAAPTRFGRRSPGSPDRCAACSSSSTPRASRRPASAPSCTKARCSRSASR